MPKPYSLDNLRTPDPVLLPKDKNQILESLGTEPIPYSNLLQTLETQGLTGDRFDDAFAALKEEKSITVSEDFFVTKNPTHKKPMSKPTSTNDALTALLTSAKDAQESANQAKAMYEAAQKDADEQKKKAVKVIDFLAENLPVGDAKSYKEGLLAQLEIQD
jgi:hypothetical protein